MQALCQGLDALPESEPALRRELTAVLEKDGLAPLQEKLAQLDPDYFRRVDKANPHRLIRALEVCLLTGKTYSELRRGKKARRPFSIVKIGLQPDRALLYRAIDARVDAMMEAGLEEEARHLSPYRAFNALNTVGYKELFEYFDGKTDRAEAVDRIKQNTRRFARRQVTWFRRDDAIQWFDPSRFESIVKAIDEALEA